MVRDVVSYLSLPGERVWAKDNRIGNRHSPFVVWAS